MSLAPGLRLGPYEVVAPLGAGGMGEVYRATDTKLDREVAIKVLPAEFTADAERLARFEREAKLLASLNHPNIAHVYGFESAPLDAASVHFLAMELVEGEDLAERLKRGAILVDEATAIAKQIAEALEEAHERGIIHRDLKPANVKLTPDGKVKVLDFGLAKAYAAESGGSGSGEVSQSPTLSRHMTEAGLILGTAAYMSPEQARGKAVDKRADIWAFGVVLFEMLTGGRLFAGETVSDTLVAVLTRDPDWSLLPPATTRSLRRLLQQCLVREPRKRLRDIGDARIALEGGPADAVAETPSPRRRSGALWLGVALLATVLVTTFVATLLRSKAPASPVRRFDILVPELRADTERHPQISPDGGRLMWVAQGSLWVRELDRVEPKLLAKDVDPMHPFWSPDGRQVAYVAAGKLWRVSADGGEPLAIADAAFRRGGSTPGGAWLADDRIIFASAARRSGLLVVPARGGDFTSFLEPAPEDGDFHSPSPLPGDRGLLVVVDRTVEGPDTIQVLSGGRRVTLVQTPGERFDSPVYSPTGHVLYQRETTNPGIWALPFSVARLEATGQPFPVAPLAGWPSVAADGTLVHTRGDPAVTLDLALVGRDGGLKKRVAQYRGGALSTPRISPDGRTIALSLRDETGSRDLYVYDVATGERTRLTFGERLQGVVWAGAGRILFAAGRGGASAVGTNVALRNADGSGETRVLLEEASEPTVAPRADSVAFLRIGDNGADIWTLPLDPTTLSPVAAQEPRPLVASAQQEHSPAIHPGGSYMAYVLDGGRRELYVTSFPEAKGKWQVTTGGIELAPVWSRSGDRLFFVQDGRLMEAEVTTRPAFRAGAPRVLFDGAAARVMLSQDFDVTADGDFVVIHRPLSAGEAAGAITIVQNWLAEFQKPGAP